MVPYFLNDKNLKGFSRLILMKKIFWFPRFVKLTSQFRFDLIVVIYISKTISVINLYFDIAHPTSRSMLFIRHLTFTK